MPLATTQHGPHDLPSAFVAVDAITTMKAHCEQTLPPALVNVVLKPGRHSSPHTNASKLNETVQDFRDLMRETQEGIVVDRKLALKF